MKTASQRTVDMVVVLVRAPNGDGIFLGNSLNPHCLNKLIGPGGKIKKGEHFFKAAQRETWEELGIWLFLRSMKHVGTMLVHREDKPTMKIYFVEALKYSGEIRLNPKDFSWGGFFNRYHIPWGELPLGDASFLMAIFDGFFVTHSVQCGKSREDVKSISTWSTSKQLD